MHSVCVCMCVCVCLCVLVCVVCVRVCADYAESLHSCVDCRSQGVCCLSQVLKANHLTGLRGQTR